MPGYQPPAPRRPARARSLQIGVRGGRFSCSRLSEGTVFLEWCPRLSEGTILRGQFMDSAMDGKMGFPVP